MLRALPLLVIVIGCASGKRAARECPELPVDLQSYPSLYRDCAVDQKARLVTTPSRRPDVTKLEPLLAPSAGASGSGCMEAVYQFVVDDTGHPVEKTVSLVRTNNRGYAAAVRDEVSTMTFEPARKGGAAVAQLYQHTWKLQYAMARAGSTPARRPPPC